jgi:hypothetical protein
MRAFTIAAVLTLSLVAPDLAAAQGGSSSRSTTPAGQAPAGHRQPQAKDVPPSDSPSAATDSDPAKTTAADRALDRALKGICRGC